MEQPEEEITIIHLEDEEVEEMVLVVEGEETTEYGAAAGEIGLAEEAMIGAEGAVTGAEEVVTGVTGTTMTNHQGEGSEKEEGSRTEKGVDLTGVIGVETMVIPTRATNHLQTWRMGISRAGLPVHPE